MIEAKSKLFQSALVALVLACLSACQSMSVTGTWQGTIPFNQTDKPVVLQMYEYGDGRVMGYLFAGSGNDLVNIGPVQNNKLPLNFEISEPGQTRSILMPAEINSDYSEMTARVNNGGNSGKAVLHRYNGILEERRFLFARPDAQSGNPGHVTFLNVVLDENGKLVTGHFRGKDDCLLFGCNGVVTSFRESGNQLAIGFSASDKTCNSKGILSVNFDTATKFYSGTYNLSDCGKKQHKAKLIGGRQYGTRSDHVAGMLSTLGLMTGFYEETASLPTRLPIFANNYEHDGLDIAGKTEQINLEMSQYKKRKINFSGLHNAITVNTPNVSSDHKFKPGIDFMTRKTGASARSAGIMVYQNDNTTTGDDSFKYFISENNSWAFVGNGYFAGLPFEKYRIVDDHLIIETPGGDVHVSTGTWGAHTPPHTGHTEGNAKADWVGQYAWSIGDLTELDGDFDNFCEQGELCGFPESELYKREVAYVAPDDDFEIHRVELVLDTAPNYGSNQHWNVDGDIGQFHYSIGHIRKIAADLRNEMIRAGYPDPWQVNVKSPNMITGKPVILKRNQKIAYPQINAARVPNHKHYVVSPNLPRETPWQQIEFFTFNSKINSAESVYSWLSKSDQEKLQESINNAASQPIWRYDNPYVHDWLWKSEMRLNGITRSSADDYSGLVSSLGGWWEVDTVPCSNGPKCDEVFAIWAIQKDTPFYDPSLYDSANVHYLVALRRAEPTNRPLTYGEVIEPATLTPNEGTLLIKWREERGTFIGYQRISYRVDASAKKLRMSWGAPALEKSGALAPSLPSNNTVCDGEYIKCYSHSRN